jgi:hypothetical protein
VNLTKEISMRLGITLMRVVVATYLLGLGVLAFEKAATGR